MIKKLIMAGFIVITLCATLKATPLNLNQLTEATCRISSFNGRKYEYGSGTCIHETTQYYYILTNAHVVGDRPIVYCEFFKYGNKTAKKPAKVIWKKFQENTDMDLALVAIEKGQFTTVKPRVVTLANPNYVIPNGGYIASVGCPNAQWPTGWEGVAMGGSSRVLFLPPPEGGRSGSGVFVVIKQDDEYYTRLAGVITWRIGDSNQQYSSDENGYPLQRGGAIPVSTLYKLINNQQMIPMRVPVYWKNVSQTQTIYGTAFCSDGKYYRCEWNGQGWSCMPPNGVSVCTWPPKPVQCGPNGCFNGLGNLLPRRPQTPIPNQPNPLPIPPANGANPNPGPNDPNSPGPIVPPDLWSKEDENKAKKLEAEIATLKNQIDAANKRIESLLDANDSFAAEKQVLKDAIAAKEATIATKEQELVTLKAQYQEAVKKATYTEEQLQKKYEEIKNYDITTKEQANKIEEQSADIQALNANMENFAEERVSFLGIKERLVERTTERNVLGGGFGLAAIALAVGAWWHRRGGKDKVHEAVESVQTTANTKIDDIQTMIDERLKKYISEETIKDLRGKVDEVQETANTTVDKAQIDIAKIIEDTIAKNLPSIVQKITGTNQETELVTPVSTIPPINITIASDGTVTKGDGKTTENFNVPQPSAGVIEKAQNSQWINELFQLKTHDGEKIEDWALLGKLYQEAVKLLEQGKLYYAASNPLQGQKLAADKINDWVSTECLSRSSTEELKNMDTINYYAMLGVLYKDAMTQLKEGKFNVLGAIETATTVDRWVRKEMFKRLNVNIN